MNITRIIVFVAALGGAAAAAFLAKGIFGSDEPATAATGIDAAEVLVAAKSVAVGTKIALGDLKWQRWPKDAIDASYVTKAAQPNAIDESIMNSVARAPLLTGEPITAQKVIKADGAGFLAAVLTPGFRAYSLKLSADRGAGGFILPNDRVDVIMTRKMGNDDDGVPAFGSKTVLRDVRVLAIDQTSKEEQGNQAIVGKTATVEVSAVQAEALALAEAMGDITLSLRSLNHQAEAKSAEEFENPFEKKGDASVAVFRYGTRASSRSSAQ
jgi:pilus assembly protein CpaB